ncbi:MAG: isoleucine--tRNA ligase [bacterium]
MSNKFVKKEEEILKFWDDNKIFEKSVEKEAPNGDYVFYDGPPFATGTPHYGHIVASIMKDVVPRYWTMRGYRVERRWGWDCHGLPIENIVEKEIGSKAKKDIVEKVGVAKFNEMCRSKVLDYVEEWKKVMTKLGRWADMENSYKTMDLDFMESVWYVFKELYDKGLIYEGYRSMHICPRCETTLSQSEVAEGYKDVKDLSVIAKFELVDEPNTFVLAWTTTPWTLIGNVALAVGEDIEYVVVDVVMREGVLKVVDIDKIEDTKIPKLYIERLVLAKDRVEDVLKDKTYKIIKEFKGKDLLGKKYRSVFDYYSNNENLENKENGWKIYAGDFVTTEEGTGIVHIAPAFGEDDMNLGKKYNLPFIQHIGMDGIIKKEAADFAGMSVKPSGDHTKTDVEIIKYLAKNNVLFAKEKYEHSYPHCWRCDTPLLNYATSSWFVAITKIKEQMLENAKGINWSPAYIKEGRFGNWLLGARDWSISRQRFWASVIPIWKCEKCGEIKVIGSVKELEDLSGEKITDIHKHIVDEIKFQCKKCDSEMTRIPDVLDTWFDSGSMPYSQMHYPFENKEKFEKNFPAKFIAEGIDQTRCWFYYMHAIATGIKNTRAYDNVIVNGIALAEDGKKMAKRLQNYPDPMDVLGRYGADALRFYLLTSPVMQAENLNFSENGVVEALRKNIMLIDNVLKFYEMFAVEKRNNSSCEKAENVLQSDNILDKWILAKLCQLATGVTKYMDGYDLVRSSRLITEFIDDLSTWYLRRSRDRFKGSDEEKKTALETTQFVLIELSKIMAPFMPFIAEDIWQKVAGFNYEDGNRSVHLEEWTEEKLKVCYDGFKVFKVIEDMAKVRKIVEIGMALRAEANIKVRQALSKLEIKGAELADDYLTLIRDELNVKEANIVENIKDVDGVKIASDGEIAAGLYINLTPELIQEGIAREVIRQINAIRKNKGFTIKDRVKVYYTTNSDAVNKALSEMESQIKEGTLADEIISSDVEDGEEVKINGEVVVLKVEKI